MSIGKVYHKCEYKFFLNFLDSNTTNIVKDIFIIPTKDIHNTYYLVVKEVLTLQKPVEISKKIQNINSDKF